MWLVGVSRAQCSVFSQSRRRRRQYRIHEGRFARAHLLGPLSEHEHHGVDHV